MTAFVVAVFVATYLVIAAGRVPFLRIDRAGAAFLGAAAMVAGGALTLEQAWRAIDADTIVLLLGMMLLVANLRLAGFFGLATAFVVARARHPLALLAAVVLLAGTLSAFLVNDTVCLVLAPLLLDIVLHLRRNPVPYLVALAVAANVGSTATITGNPQNIIIGALSGIPYGRFAAALSPVAAFGLALTVLVVALAWRREFLTRARLAAEVPAFRLHRALLIETLLATAALVAAFFAGARPAVAAAVAGGVLLVGTRVKPRRLFAEVDWTLLVMFGGLFVVVAALERTVLTPEMLRGVGALRLDSMPVLAGVTAVLSQLVSNVPAVLVLRPFVAALPQPEPAWLTVAMASTLAGTLTVPGSVANLIVVQWARARGVTIGFWTYAMAGAPVAVATILAGLAWLSP